MTMYPRHIKPGDRVVVYDFRDCLLELMRGRKHHA